MALRRSIGIATSLFLSAQIAAWPSAMAVEIDNSLIAYPTIHFIIFANGDYRKSDRLKELKGAPDDFKLAFDMFNGLKPQIDSPHKVMIHGKLSAGENTNEFKSVDELNDKLEMYMEHVKQGDVVVFYYSGHGVSYGQLDYLVPTEFDPSKVNEQDVALGLASTGRVAGLLGKNSPSNVVMLLDACRDGAAFDVGGNSQFPKATAIPNKKLIVIDADESPGSTIYDSVFPIGPGGVAPVTSDFTQALSKAIAVLKGDNLGVSYSALAILTSQYVKDLNPKLDWNATGKSSVNVDLWPNKAFWTNIGILYEAIAKNPTPDSIRRFWARNPFSQYYAAVKKYLQDIASEDKRLPQSVEVSSGKNQIAGKVDDAGSTIFNPISVDAAFDEALIPGQLKPDLAAVVVPAFSFRFTRVADDSQTESLQKLSLEKLGVVKGATREIVLANGAALTEKLGGNGELFAQQLRRGGSLVPIFPAQVTLENFTGAKSISPKYALPNLKYDLDATAQFDAAGGEILAQIDLQPPAEGPFTDFDPQLNPAIIRSPFGTIKKMNLKFRKFEGVLANNTQILGRPLREILVKPKMNADFLVESDDISDTLKKLKASNAVLNWVSIATGPLSAASANSSELKEFEDAARQLRLSHAASFFLDAKVPVTSITYVLGDQNLKPGETRIRIFGF